MTKNKLYTMTKTMADKLHTESEEKVSLIQDSLCYFLSADVIDSNIVAMLCDTYSSNFHIRKEISTVLENADLLEDEEKLDALPITSQSLVIVESALISSYAMSNELAKRNVSLLLN